MQVPFRIVRHGEVNAVMIGSLLVDYGVDEPSLRAGLQVCNHVPARMKGLVQDIVTHFLDCFSRHVGRPLTLREFLDCLKAGAIDVADLPGDTNATG